MAKVSFIEKVSFVSPPELPTGCSLNSVGHLGISGVITTPAK
jgi:hypothetical protein